MNTVKLSGTYIIPASETDAALVALRSAIDGVMDPKHRQALVNEAMLSDFIKDIHQEALALTGYLCEIEEEADHQILVDDVAERIGGFA